MYENLLLKRGTPLLAPGVGFGSKIAHDFPSCVNSRHWRGNWELAKTIQFHFERCSGRILQRQKDPVIPWDLSGFHAPPEQINGGRKLVFLQYRKCVGVEISIPIIKRNCESRLCRYSVSQFAAKLPERNYAVVLFYVLHLRSK